jgi:hypothetical protein
MGKRKQIFNLIDEQVTSPTVGDIIKDYISNLHKKNSELEETIQKRKDRIKRAKRPKPKRCREIKG